MSGRTLGYGLLGGAGVLALLMLAWLAVSGASGGGIVLGLILLVVLAGPLAFAGFVVLQRQPLEVQAARVVARKQQVLDADRLFRREIAPALRQLGQQPALPAARLEALAADLERSSYDSPEWYDSVQLEDTDTATLKRYEDLVWDRLRLLRDRATAGAASEGELSQAVSELEQAIDQRRDLLIRGRRAPAAPPSVLMRAGAPAQGADAVRDLALGDAVTTSDGEDYVVESVATYFAEGQTWKLAHLVTTAGGGEHWLYVGPAGLELALLDEVGGLGELRQVGAGTATVDVDSQAGSVRGALVRVTRYATGDRLGLQEEWPDGARHAYAGATVAPTTLEVWPAARSKPS